jgi:primosomal protein N'
MAVEPGSVVIAPLGPRQIVGIVWEAERLPATEVPESKLRPLVGVLPVPPLKAELRRLIEWTADYYCAPARRGRAHGPRQRRRAARPGDDDRVPPDRRPASSA